MAVDPACARRNRHMDLSAGGSFWRIDEHATVGLHVDGDPAALSTRSVAHRVANQLLAIAHASLHVARDTLHPRLSPTRVIWITCSTTDLAFSRPTSANSFGSSPLRIAVSMFWGFREFSAIAFRTTRSVSRAWSIIFLCAAASVAANASSPNTSLIAP